MSEQDHASLRDKQRRAIREVMPNVTAEECDRLVGALAEIREEVASVFANPRATLMRALLSTVRSCSFADAYQFVGDLSEFVRGIVREEVRANKSLTMDWLSAWAMTRSVGLCTCLADWREHPTIGCVVPVSSTCPAHGMGRSTPHTHSTVIE